MRKSVAEWAKPFSSELMSQSENRIKKGTGVSRAFDGELQSN
jgi:hypothetical protein